MSNRINLAIAWSVITLFVTPVVAEPLKVVASFSIIGDLVENVGGDRIELTTLVGANGDAHVYEPKPADAVAVAGADVVLVNGLHFEGFLQRLVEASATKAQVVEVTAGVTPLRIAEQEDEAEGDHASKEAGNEGHGHDHGAIDPHAFQSIRNVEIYVRNIAKAFCVADAEGCHVYDANADAYTEELKATDAIVRAAVESIPADKRVIITSHDAFGYFAKEYGLTFVAPEGISTESEASAADVAALIEQVRHDKASAIFVENITNQRLVEQIASETGLKIGGTLYSDALSGPEGPAPTYIGMMQNNIRVIRGAILGS